MSEQAKHTPDYDLISPDAAPTTGDVWLEHDEDLRYVHRVLEAGIGMTDEDRLAAIEIVHGLRTTARSNYRLAATPVQPQPAPEASPPKSIGESIPWVLRPSGRTIPDLTKREHVCEWQRGIKVAAPEVDGQMALGARAIAVLRELIEASDAQDDMRLSHPGIRAMMNSDYILSVGPRVDAAWAAARALVKDKSQALRLEGSADGERA